VSGVITVCVVDASGRIGLASEVTVVFVLPRTALGRVYYCASSLLGILRSFFNNERAPPLVAASGRYLAVQSQERPHSSLVLLNFWKVTT